MSILLYKTVFNWGKENWCHVDLRKYLEYGRRELGRRGFRLNWITLKSLRSDLSMSWEVTKWRMLQVGSVQLSSAALNPRVMVVFEGREQGVHVRIQPPHVGQPVAGVVRRRAPRLRDRPRIRCAVPRWRRVPVLARRDDTQQTDDDLLDQLRQDRVRVNAMQCTP